MSFIAESTNGILSIIPLISAHAEELFTVLSDAELYRFTDDRPPESLQWLSHRFERLESRKSPDGTQHWLNWVVQKGVTGECIGTVQATVTLGSADLAWVIGVIHQGRGYATMAAHLMVSLLVRAGCTEFTCHIKADHVAISRVAQKIGFIQTNEVEDGECVWRMSKTADQGNGPDTLKPTGDS